MVFGGSAGWDDFRLEGLGEQRAQGGGTELVLTHGEYPAGVPGRPMADLLLHFNVKNYTDILGPWQVGENLTRLSAKTWKLGGGAAAFEGDGSQLTLKPQRGSLFWPGQRWHDFTLEFWLYPGTLDDEAALLEWKGAFKGEAGFVNQTVRVGLRGRKLVYRFDHFFATPDGRTKSLELPALEGLIPRQWAHHLLRFDAATGLLEYAVNGRVGNSVYVTADGHEGSQVFLPYIGPLANNPVTLGRGLNGLLDELRLSPEVVEAPILSEFMPSRGILRSRVLDLGRVGSFVRSIQAKSRLPAGTDLQYFYRMADVKQYQWQAGAPSQEFLARPPQSGDDTSWIPFTPGETLLPPDGTPRARGRYLEILVEFLPDGTGKVSPVLSQLTVDFRTNPPPPAPGFVDVVAGNGSLTVRWLPVTQGHIGGYTVFFGTEPGKYLGAISAEGPSPLDAGKGTPVAGEKLVSFRLTGLENGKLYYLAVAAYEKLAPPVSTDPGVAPTDDRRDPIFNHSNFSREVTGRPLRTLP